MKGRITKLDKKRGTGLILGEDWTEYRFETDETQGLEVQTFVSFTQKGSKAVDVVKEDEHKAEDVVQEDKHKPLDKAPSAFQKLSSTDARMAPYMRFLLFSFALWPVACLSYVWRSRKSAEAKSKPKVIILGVTGLFWFLLISNPKALNTQKNPEGWHNVSKIKAEQICFGDSGDTFYERAHERHGVIPSLEDTPMVNSWDESLESRREWTVSVVYSLPNGRTWLYSCDVYYNQERQTPTYRTSFGTYP